MASPCVSGESLLQRRCWDSWVWLAYAEQSLESLKCLFMVDVAVNGVLKTNDPEQ